MKKYNKGAVLAIAGSALVSTVAVGANFAPSTLAAFTDTTASSGNTAAAGTLNIAMLDDAGSVTNAATVAILNASPTMQTRTYPLRLVNQGTLAASMRVHSMNLDGTVPSLDDVLKVQILDQASNVVYTGKVSGIDFLQPNIGSASNATYTINVTWPDGGATDNPYQGATMTFDLTADASVVAGQ